MTKLRYLALWITFFFCIAPFSSLLAQQKLPAIIKRIEPSTVVILTYDKEGQSLAQASGFFINESGDVITNRHVLQGASRAVVKVAGDKVYPVTLVMAEDKEGDLIRVSVGIPRNAVRPLLVSVSLPEVGERIIVIGNPLGLEGTVSDGIVSAVRKVPTFGNIIQITAPISQGSSGSPVVNMKGEVIGVATFLMVEGQNLNFAIPGERVSRLAPGKGQTLAEWEADRAEQWVASAEELYSTGLVFLWAKEYEKALPYFEKAVKKKPDYAEAYFGIGYCKNGLERYDEAIEAFKQAIRIKSDYADAHYNLGVIYDKLGRYDEAIEAYKQAFKKKATAIEIGTALRLFVRGSEDSNQAALKNLPADAKVDQQSIQNELLYLRAFVVDFATTITLGNTPEKIAVLDVYYAHLEEMAKESSAGALVYENLKSRLLIYTLAVKTPHHNGPAWTVGKAFAELCGSEMDVESIMLGSIVFTVTLKEVSEFIKSCRIIVEETNEIQAQEGHHFIRDLKEAYKASQLTYDAKVDHLLFSKLPKSRDESERLGLILEPPRPKNAEEERILEQTIEALFRQFFKKVKTGGKYCPVEEIKRQFGQSPEERIGISSGGYYRLFTAYWTLRAKLKAYQEINNRQYGYANLYYIDALISLMESTLAGAFFPTPGSTQISESQRREGVQEMLKASAPEMTIKELYEGVDPHKARWPILKSENQAKTEKKLILIRKLFRKRMQNDPVLKKQSDDWDVDTIPEAILIGLPEATIVTIVETYWIQKSQTNMSDKEIFEAIEAHRSMFFNAGTMPSPLTLSSYIKYRLSMEHSQGVPISSKFVDEAIKEANRVFGLIR